MTTPPETPDDFRTRPSSPRDPQNKPILLLVALGIVLGILVVAGLTWFRSDSEGTLSYLTNLFTEAISIVITVVLVGIWSERRAEVRRVEQLKKDLVRFAGKPVNDIAKDAVDELWHYGWLEGQDGLLKGANLRNANLEGADLTNANLQGADLFQANLQASNLYAANLTGAYLSLASLQGARLNSANLQGARLNVANLQGTAFTRANLQHADLRGTNPQGAVLAESNLQGASLEGAEFTEQSRLPDSSNWTPDTDMARFANPYHPDFWRSDNPESPAYRGEDVE